MPQSHDFLADKKVIEPKISAETKNKAQNRIEVSFQLKDGIC